MTPLGIFLVDDETPARNRLRQLLDDLAPELATRVTGEASNGVEALDQLTRQPADVVLVDIRMPRMDGLQFALHAARLPKPPAVIFTTAYDRYAVQAFDLAAVDYLLKPVRAERLAEALRKTHRRLSDAALRVLAPQGRRQLRCSERGRVVLIPLDEVLYLKAELKYVTVRTASGEHLLEEPLTQLEAEFGERFLRVHRNCLVARNAIVGYERGMVHEGETEAQWLLRLQGAGEKIAVSRRQWPQVKMAIEGGGAA